MQSAKLILDEMLKSSAYYGNQTFVIFINQISLAINPQTVLNQEQKKFLSGVISARYMNTSHIDSMAIATWINSCR